MNTTDPIADMLTRIRNANTSKHTEVDIPASNMKKAIAQILVDEGYIKSFEEVDYFWIKENFKTRTSYICKQGRCSTSN